MQFPRLGFADAISDDLALGKAFQRLSGPQQMVLKAVYGLPLSEEELVWWSAFNGRGEYDELGALQGISEHFPYTPCEYADVTLVFGRRSGKSSKLASFVVCYEALFGGHSSRVDTGQSAIFLQVAQDLDTARENLRQHILPLIESSPVGLEELKRAKKDRKEAITADAIRLRPGNIVVGPPSIKLRGQAIACCAMDELAVWPKDRESSNPDFEVERAVTPALAQFHPYEKLIKVSTPMTEEGLLWTAAETGTGGHLLGADAPSAMREANARRLVLQAPTAALSNPKVKRAFLSEQRAKDGEAFAREYLARFAKSVTGFLSASLLRAAVSPRVRQRPPEAGRLYIATLDPAFRRDAFAFCIGHLAEGEWYQDYATSWRGTRENPLSPSVAMATVGETCKTYGVRLVVTDQYHQESLSELAYAHGLVLEPCYLTYQVKAQIWGATQAMLHQASGLPPVEQATHGMQRLHLLDNDAVVDELAKMEKRLTSAGNVQFEGKHDDLATVVALNVWKAVQLGEACAAKPVVVKPVSLLIKERLHQQGRDRAPWWAN